MLQTEIKESRSEGSLRSVTAVFAMAFALGLFLLYFLRLPLDTSILETQVQQLNLESTLAQSLFYVGLLGLFASLCAALLVWPKARIIRDSWNAERLLTPTLVGVATVLGSWSVESVSGFFFGASVLLVSRWGGVDGVLVKWVERGLVSSILTMHSSSRIMLALLVLYFALFLIAPLATPLVIHGFVELRSVDGHYAATVLPGFDLVCCTEVGTIERANYGLGMPLLTALTLKVLQLVGISDTALVQVVKVNQVAAAAMICVLVYFSNRQHFLSLATLVLGMTAFTLSNVGVAVGFPNQAGIRYVPMLVSVFILLLEIRNPRPRTWLLAAVAAIFVVLSPETGLAAAAGYLVASVLTCYSRTSPLGSVTGTVAQFLAIFFATGIAVSALLVESVLKNGTGGLFQFLALFTSGGYGGMVDRPSLTATLIFFVATTAVLRAVFRARNGTLSSADIWSAAIGTVMIVWLMYYVNRMSEWNLWFQLVLLTLLPAPIIMQGGFNLPRWQSNEFQVTIPMVVACLICGQLASSASRFAPRAMEWIDEQYHGCGEGTELDGKCIPGFRDTRFSSQLSALVEHYSTTDTLVLSGMSTYARLRGFNDGFPWYDAMEIVRKSDVQSIVSWIELRGPRYIVVDDPTFDIARAAPEHSRQIQSYLPYLLSYRQVRKEAGWIVLMRNGLSGR